MRRPIRIACTTAALAAAAVVAACAASGDEPREVPSDPDGDVTPPIPDGDAGDAIGDAAVDGPMCSPAGWCATPLPDPDLTMKDIWPLEGRAFAVAESPTLGVKVLEWDDDSAKWSYIDDGTQNEAGFGDYVGKVWAPNENEVYYGVAPAYVYHGTRPLPPATAWSWVRHRLEDRCRPSGCTDRDRNPGYKSLGADEKYPALGVWGTSSDDVYAWSANTIFHWKNDEGGAPAWTVEYVADDAASAVERLVIVGAAGADRDDVWFSGARLGNNFGDWSACAVVIRKTHAAYRRIADGVVPTSNNTNELCGQREGRLVIGRNGGWLTGIQSPAKGRALAINGARDVVRISEAGDGGYSIDMSRPPTTVTSTLLLSLWSSAEDRSWLSGVGGVVQAANVWDDSSAYQVSTIALNGAAPRKWFYQIRGTSNTNLWVVGEGYALHKTTP